MNEQALKARIKHIAKEQDKNFNEVWKLLVLERFLARLSRSEYSDKFISLEVYPVETIFAEKLETLISRGAANSRMKDYHDLLLLCRESMLIDKVRLKDKQTSLSIYRKSA